MKLGIIADTHDNLPSIRRALECFSARGVEAIIHAGDVVAPFAAKALAEFPGPVHAVYGNCDGERAGLAKVLDIVPSPRVVELGGLKILVAHDAVPSAAVSERRVPRSAGSGCARLLRATPTAALRTADIVVTGHTHEVAVSPGSSPDQPLRLNPGEACGWVRGRPTCIVLDTETLAAEVVELGEIA